MISFTHYCFQTETSVDLTPHLSNEDITQEHRHKNSLYIQCNFKTEINIDITLEKC